MKQPTPVTVRTRPIFKAYLWIVTLACFGAAIGLTIRASNWLRFISEEPTLLALVLPVILFFALTGWMGRWALFHSTAQVTVDAKGIKMQSLIVNDTLRWRDIEAIRLQGTSGSEVQLVGKEHRVTLPSGSSVLPNVTLQVEDWINYKLGDKDVEYGSVHFWGP